MRDQALLLANSRSNSILFKPAPKVKFEKLSLLDQNMFGNPANTIGKRDLWANWNITNCFGPRVLTHFFVVIVVVVEPDGEVYFEVPVPGCVVVCMFEVGSWSKWGLYDYSVSLYLSHTNTHESGTRVVVLRSIVIGVVVAAIGVWIVIRTMPSGVGACINFIEYILAVRHLALFSWLFFLWYLQGCCMCFLESFVLYRVACLL